MEQPTKTISKPNTLFPKFEWDVSMLRSFYNNGIATPTPRRDVRCRSQGSSSRKSTT